MGKAKDVTWRSGAYGTTVAPKALVEVTGALGRGLSRSQKFATERTNATNMVTSSKENV